jgi:hypothetical protein
MNEHTAATEEPTVIRCCTCGLPITTRETPRLEGEPCCLRCLSGFAAAVRQASEAGLPSTSLIPWLRCKELGVVRAFVQTVRDGLSHPTRFFARLPAVSQPWAPLLFAVACTLVFYFPGLFINYTLISPAILQQLQQTEENQQVPAYLSPIFDQLALQMSDQSATRWMRLILYLLQFIVMEVLFASWIQQIFVYLAGSRQGFEATLQVRCYSLVGMSFLLIPVVGWIIGQVYWIAINALGLRQVHRISGWMSALAAISPLLVLWLLPLVFWFRMIALGPGTGAG